MISVADQPGSRCFGERAIISRRSATLTPTPYRGHGHRRTSVNCSIFKLPVATPPPLPKRDGCSMFVPVAVTDTEQSRSRYLDCSRVGT